MKFLLLFLMSVSLQAKEVTKLKFEGNAVNSKNDLVYVEKHEALFSDSRVQSSVTQYFDPQGKLIAELKSDYTKSMFVPDYTFTDLRTEMFHKVELKDKKVFVTARKNKTSEEKKEEIPFLDNMITGQGFHYFIRENLEKFDQKNQKVKFLLPGLLDYFTFNIAQSRAPSQENPIVYLKMTINSLFLKPFVSKVYMEYDKFKKYLLKYEGASNLETLEGKPQEVKITYKYL